MQCSDKNWRYCHAEAKCHGVHAKCGDGNVDKATDSMNAVNCSTPVRWLTFLVCASLLMSFEADARCQQAHTLDGFPRTAFDSWHQYYNDLKIYGADATIEFTRKSDGLGTQLSKWIEKDGQFAVERNGAEYAKAVNSKYSFTLSSKTSGTPAIFELNMAPTASFRT